MTIVDVLDESDTPRRNLDGPLISSPIRADEGSDEEPNLNATPSKNANRRNLNADPSSKVAPGTAQLAVEPLSNVTRDRDPRRKGKARRRHTTRSSTSRQRIRHPRRACECRHSIDDGWIREVNDNDTLTPK